MGDIMSKCRVCDAESDNKRYIVKEMMFGTRDEFEYYICPSCGCMQIENIPVNLGQYYSGEYYSYNEPSINKVVEKKDYTRVLDVGCGAGSLLCSLADEGFANLTGCDPFIEHDLSYENGVKIYKKNIHEMEGEFDWIYLNDSFEHMSDPNEVMESIYRLLAPNGIARIKIPVFPNIAWDMFGVNWYQLDAPRHIILHSKKSMKYLIEKHCLRLIKMEFDSSIGQIYTSYMYEMDIPYTNHDFEYIRKSFSVDDMKSIQESVDEANRNEYGDHAAFYIMKR